MNKEKHICIYGCGKEATHQFKNGKWCCSKSHHSCDAIKNNPERIRRMKEKLKGKIPWCSGLTINTDERIKKLSNSGSKNGMFGKKHKEKSVKLMREKRLGKFWSEESKQKNRDSWNKNGKRENHIQRMKNGQASYMNKFITNPSKPECMLRNIILELYPSADFQHTVLNYSLDVAIPEYKIAIEYDGWYHFDSERSKEYFRNRKERIENEGWKMISYTMFNKFPSKEQVNNDIEEMINECE